VKLEISDVYELLLRLGLGLRLGLVWGYLDSGHSSGHGVQNITVPKF